MREGRGCAPGEGRGGAPAARLPARGNGNGRADPAPTGGLPETTWDHPRSAVTPPPSSLHQGPHPLSLFNTPSPCSSHSPLLLYPPFPPNFPCRSPSPSHPPALFPAPGVSLPTTPSPSSLTHPFSPNPPHTADPVLLLLYPAMPRARPPSSISPAPSPLTMAAAWLLVPTSKESTQVPATAAPGRPPIYRPGGGPSAPAPPSYWPPRPSIREFAPLIG